MPGPRMGRAAAAPVRTPVRIGHAHDDELDDLLVLQQHALHIQRRDLVAAWDKRGSRGVVVYTYRLL